MTKTIRRKGRAEKKAVFNDNITVVFLPSISTRRTVTCEQ